jgi:hypothetical protein
VQQRQVVGQEGRQLVFTIRVCIRQHRLGVLQQAKSSNGLLADLQFDVENDAAVRE